MYNRVSITCEEVVAAQAKTMKTHSSEVMMLRRIVHTLRSQLLQAGIKPLVELGDERDTGNPS